MNEKRFAFTKKAIEALQPHVMDSPSREAEYTDMESSGLHLRVSKNGRNFPGGGFGAGLVQEGRRLV